jgi:hypothetical protein
MPERVVQRFHWLVHSSNVQGKINIEQERRPAIPQMGNCALSEFPILSRHKDLP